MHGSDWLFSFPVCRKGLTRGASLRISPFDYAGARYGVLLETSGLISGSVAPGGTGALLAEADARIMGGLGLMGAACVTGVLLAEADARIMGGLRLMGAARVTGILLTEADARVVSRLRRVEAAVGVACAGAAVVAGAIAAGPAVSAGAIVVADAARGGAVGASIIAGLAGDLRIGDRLGSRMRMHRLFMLASKLLDLLKLLDGRLVAV